MKHLYLLLFTICCSLTMKGQDFTISQTTTGMTQEIFGQGFTPSVQGNGTGTVPSESLVDLTEFSFMIDDNDVPEILYIYEKLPDNQDALTNGNGGTLVGQSIDKTEESFWYTNYKFDNLTLNKDKMYYALFRKITTCEVGGGAYDGGLIFRQGDNGEFNTTTYANARFKASFVAYTSTNISKNKEFSIQVQPNITKGEVMIVSDKPAIIEVYALTGSKLKTIKVEQGKNPKSIEDLPKGIYFFICNNSKICKVVKK